MNKTKKPVVKKENPEKKLRIEHLYKIAELMHKAGHQNLEVFYLKNMKGTAEKNVYPLPTDIKRLYCKPCTIFMDTSDSTIYECGGLTYKQSTCPSCGCIRKHFTQPKRSKP